jgi:hypothetical protein
MGHRPIIGAVAMTTAVLAAGGWGAAPARAANTFDGTCRLSGELRFDPPLGNDLRAAAIKDDAVGTCTGTVNDVAVDNAPVTNRATGSGMLSCMAGQATTADTLNFGHGVKVDFSTDTIGGLTQFTAHFSGAASGDGVVYVNFLPYTDQSALAACQAGALRSTRYDLVARTLTPVTG